MDIISLIFSWVQVIAGPVGPSTDSDNPRPLPLPVQGPKSRSMHIIDLPFRKMDIVIINGDKLFQNLRPFL